MKARISRSLLAQIVDRAAGEAAEICGLLTGSAGSGAYRIEGHIAAANVAPDPARHFELDPAVLIVAHRAARAGGAQVIGHYHSHPSGLAMPSATDAACAAPDGSLWLIIADGTARLWVAGPGEGGVRFGEAHLDIA